MKQRTLAWAQITVGLVLLFKFVMILSTTNSAYSLGYLIGSYADLLLISLFALITGVFNFNKK